MGYIKQFRPSSHFECFQNFIIWFLSEFRKQWKSPLLHANRLCMPTQILKMYNQRFESLRTQQWGLKSSKPCLKNRIEGLEKILGMDFTSTPTIAENFLGMLRYYLIHIKIVSHPLSRQYPHILRYYPPPVNILFPAC